MAPETSNRLLRRQLDRWGSSRPPDRRYCRVWAERPGWPAAPSRREHGGHVDIKDLGVDNRVYMPVFVPGGLFSIGDLHLAQGDGEITFCGAIETPGFIDLHFNVIKGGMDRYKTDMPFFKPGPRGSELLRVPDLPGHQRRGRAQLLHERHRGLSAGS